MTMTFSVLLALIFLMEFGAGIAAYMLRNDVSRISNSVGPFPHTILVSHLTLQIHFMEEYQ